MVNHNKRCLPWLGTLIYFFISSSWAAQSIEEHFKYPFYMGFSAGYGSTTWDQLSPRKANDIDAISLSTPIGANEGGLVGGAFVGVELFPYFALELSYFKFPDATIHFDEESLFAFYHDGLTELTSATETVSIMGKVMLVIPHTFIRAYSSAGVAGVHRSDSFLDRWSAAPTFGVGFNYNFTQHFMGELAANYTGGYGESELEPAKDFIPFLYSVFLRIAYRF